MDKNKTLLELLTPGLLVLVGTIMMVAVMTIHDNWDLWCSIRGQLW